MKKQALGIILLGFFCFLPFINLVNIVNSTEYTIDNGDSTISSTFYEKFYGTEPFTFQNQVCKISPRFLMETTYIWVFGDEFVKPNGTFRHPTNAEGWAGLNFNSAIDRREEYREGFNWYFHSYNQINSIEILISILNGTGNLIPFSHVNDNIYMNVYVCLDTKKYLEQSNGPCDVLYLNCTEDLIKNRLDILQINDSFDTIYDLKNKWCNSKRVNIVRDPNLKIDNTGDFGKWDFNVQEFQPRTKSFIGMISMRHDIDQILLNQNTTYIVRYCVQYSHHEVLYNRFFGYKENRTIWTENYMSTCQIAAI